MLHRRYARSCALPWVRFAVTRCAPKELDRLLGDIASRVADFEGQQQVSKCVASLLKSTVEEGEVVEIFTLSNYLPLFDVLQSEDKTSLALLILERVIDVPESKIKDPALVPKLMYLCETVANAISVISTKGLGVCVGVHFVVYKANSTKMHSLPFQMNHE